MTLTSYGKREWGSALIAFFLIFSICVTTAIFKILHPYIACVITFFTALFCFAVCAFFRNPHRTIASDKTAIVSPADGVIKDIESLKSESLENDDLRNLFRGSDVIRIGIFLSVFNVHLNRAPWDINVSFKRYKPGKYLDARHPNAGKENESMLIGGICPLDGEVFPLAVKQVSGAIARRIVCPVNAGETYSRGQIYGMIKFGSRTELYIPAGMGIDVAVNVGDSVRAGSSPIALIRPEAKVKFHKRTVETSTKVMS